MPLVINLKQTDTGLVCRSENTTRFYNDIRKFSVPTKEEETKMFETLQGYKDTLEIAKKDGDKELCKYLEGKVEEARNAIINSNQRLCVAAAKNWATTDTLMDYVNEANIGLSEALDRFDYRKGFKFASYAMWYVKRAIEEYHHNVKPIVHRTNNSKTWSIVSKATNDFMQENERIPSSEELKDIVNQKLKKGIKDKSDLLDIQITMVDEFPTADENVNHSEVIDYNRASSTDNEYEVKAEEDFQKALVSSLLETLTPREKKVIQMRFGLIEVNGIKREFELSEVAEEVGLTSERIRQMELSIINKLKKEYQERLFSMDI
jgi:RNA polymerase sigma factor (sigma-70 family)